jgi:predicted DNA-binding protein (UPF0251 family)
VLEQETVRHFGEALRVAWRRLTPREALALAFKFRHGLPQRTVARLLGVGEARVSRLVHAGVEKVKAALQEGSAADPGETWADRGRCWTVLTRVVREHLQSAAGPSDSPKERSGT